MRRQHLTMISVAAATVAASHPPYGELYNTAEAAFKADGCGATAKAISEGTARHLKRVGDPNAERPFLTSCSTRSGVTLDNCRCLADAVRIGEPQVFRLMYDGRQQTALINWFGPLYLPIVSARCGAIPPR